MKVNGEVRDGFIDKNSRRRHLQDIDSYFFEIDSADEEGSDIVINQITTVFLSQSTISQLTYD